LPPLHASGLTLPVALAAESEIPLPSCLQITASVGSSLDFQRNDEYFFIFQFSISRSF
jgi:hypothetical protein